MTLKDWAALRRGNQASLAAAIKVAAPLVSQWCSGERRVPAERCCSIQVATGGAVTCIEMRPDVFDVHYDLPASDLAHTNQT